MRDVLLLDEPFVPESLIGSFSDAHPALGAVCSFAGTVRSDPGVEALELSHYEPITLPGVHALADQVCARFDLLGILIVHRVGLLRVGEPIVCVTAAAQHRRAAIDAVDFTMDHLKSAAWFWKRERRNDGWHWIEPRADDRAALARWQS